MGTLKCPIGCLWRWEPDRGSDFLSLHAHLVPSHMKYRCMCDVKLPISHSHLFIYSLIFLSVLPEVYVLSTRCHRTNWLSPWGHRVSKLCPPYPQARCKWGFDSFTPAQCICSRSRLGSILRPFPDFHCTIEESVSKNNRWSVSVPRQAR